MKRVTLTVMAVLFAAAFATTVFAFGWGRGPGYGPCARGDFQGPAGLNLTAEQTAKIKEMKDAEWKEVKLLQEQTFTKRDEIRKLWLEPSPDQARILAAQKQMQSLRDQIEDKMTTFRQEAAKVLTPEQREKIGSFDEGPGHRHLQDLRVWRFVLLGPGRQRGPGHQHDFGPMQGFGPGASGRARCFGCPGF